MPINLHSSQLHTWDPTLQHQHGVKPSQQVHWCSLLCQAHPDKPQHDVLPIDITVPACADNISYADPES